MQKSLDPTFLNPFSRINTYFQIKLHDKNDMRSRAPHSTWYSMTSQWNFGFAHRRKQRDWCRENLLAIVEFSSKIPKRLWNFHQNEYRNIYVWAENLRSEYIYSYLTILPAYFSALSTSLYDRGQGHLRGWAFCMKSKSMYVMWSANFENQFYSEIQV